MRCENVNEASAIVTITVLLLYISKSSKILLEGQVSELVDRLKLSVNIFVASLKQQTASVLNSLDKLTRRYLCELELWFKLGPGRPQ